MKLADRRRDALNAMMVEAIYGAAIRVLTEHGLDGMTMDRVAAAAEVAKGSLYNYFRNKKELVEFVHQRLLDPMRETIEEILRSDRPAPRKLEAMIRAWFDYVAEHRAVFTLFFQDHGTRVLLETSEHHESALALAVRDTAAALEQGVAEGAFRPLDVEAVAHMLVGAVRQMFERQFASDSTSADEGMVGTVFEVFLRGIQAAR
jgi:AcrR family transcriptional regulator